MAYLSALNAFMKFYFLPLLGAVVYLNPITSFSQPNNHINPSFAVKIAPPVGVRLGAWLTSHYPDLTANMYPQGLMWFDRNAATSQKSEKELILNRILEFKDSRSNSIDELAQFMMSLPVTGRVMLPVQDAWLMQAHKNLEPIMSEGSTVVLNSRPDRIRIIDSNSNTCDVYFQDLRMAADYLRACGADSPKDAAWLIQPDGVVTHIHTGVWNQTTQVPPAPGAWIWLSPLEIPLDLQRDIAQIMATQGPVLASGPAVFLSNTYQKPRDLKTHLNDWGMTGLQQTPTARTAQAGHAGITISRVWPYTHTTLTINPFDAIEVGMRYTDISNVLYGPLIAGDQSYKDKSSEIKWRFLNETKTRPALAIGLRDPGGTGLFAGEYIVASKRLNNFDMSLGLGWGNLGHQADLENPLRIFGSRFSKRQTGVTGSGGTVQLGPTFTGKTALFGGIQWQTPVPELVLKIERDGNNYRNEPFQNDVGGVRSSINWGMTWAKGPLSLSFGQERGRQWMLGMTVRTDLSQLTRLKSSEPASWKVTKPFIENNDRGLSNRRMSNHPIQTRLTQKSKDWLLDQISKQAGWSSHSLHEEEGLWVIDFENALGYSLPERIDRAVAVLHAAAPDEIRHFQFVLKQHGVPVSSRLVERAVWVHERVAWRGHEPQQHSVAVMIPALKTERGHDMPSGRLSLGYQQHLGGPDGYLYALNANAQGHWALRNGTWLQGTARMRMSDNYEKFRYTAPSALPRVRTHVREYLTSERVTLQNLQINHLHQWHENVYSLAYAGALESMFAGVGAEIMWRPIDSRWALGADVNKLAQRDFDQRFGLRDYRVKSGHITAYLDTKWQGVEGKLVLGQYLAGDRGATVELSKRFENGARMGAWVTKTNVSSRDFGEGSFDKGVFISIPFDNFLSAWSNQRAHFAWQPLIRDGGARLNRSQTLWNLTNSRDSREWHGKAHVAR
jgi:hypothetical protein